MEAGHKIRGGGPLRGSLRVPGDKSISHRALLLAALANGESELFGLGPGADVQSSLGLIDSLGINIEIDEFGCHFIQGCGGVAPEIEVRVDCQNSGTTARIGMGLLSGLHVTAFFDGDASLRERPMGRVRGPLSVIGARIDLSDQGTLPATVLPTTLMGGDVQMELASAQVESAVMFAAIQCDNETVLHTVGNGRDHTQRMFEALSLEIDPIDDGFVLAGSEVPGFQLDVAGDPSSAAFFLCGAAMIPQSACSIEGMYLNPTRIAFLEILRAMGAQVHISEMEYRLGEPVGDVQVTSGELAGVEIDSDLIPALIDEIPVLAVVAAFALGQTTFRGAGELAFKESNRLEQTAALVRALGAEVELFDDGMTITGTAEVGDSLTFDAAGDHRMAMAAGIAAVALPGTSTIYGAHVVDISYPTFWSDLAQLRDRSHRTIEQ